MRARQILIALAIKHKGDWGGFYQDIVNKTEPTEEELAKAENVEAITLLDDEYPNCLKEIVKPPFVLFYKGNKELLNKDNIVAVAGSRKPKESIKRFAEKFVANQKSKTIITGISLGVNTIALKTALKNGISPIVVLGSGIDYCYPEQNQKLYEEVAQKGLIISEYPFNELPQTDNFPMRNRIISGLANQVCFMDLLKRSGSAVLANFALMNGKEIFVVPSIDDEENVANDLINEGANCLTLSTIL